jgi:hypothetical protein
MYKTGSGNFPCTSCEQGEEKEEEEKEEFFNH